MKKRTDKPKEMQVNYRFPVEQVASWKAASQRLGLPDFRSYIELACDSLSSGAERTLSVVRTAQHARLSESAKHLRSLADFLDPEKSPRK